jgi:integrase
LSVFFGWCADEKMIAENPFTDIKRPHVDRREPAVLTVEQAKKMLENTDGQDRAYAAIGMFAGVRPEEIMKMNWSMVDLMNGSIRLPGSICKTRVGRSIDLEPNAISWLRTVHARKGPIFSGDASCLTRRLRLAAGLETWPQDVLRHTYASMHVCHFRDASKTALALHDRRAPDILFRFYFRDQLQDDAKKFWSMMPGKYFRDRTH